MSPTAIPYGFSTEVTLPFAEALEQTREALAAQGFGVLCEIDVAATLRQKLGVDFPPYVILGACNPPLAHRALTADPNVGLLLPCNVVVREGATPKTSVVTAIDPEKQLQIADGDALRGIARQVSAKLWDALIALSGDAKVSPSEKVDVAEEVC